jgi:hypothetical protein
MDAYLLERQLSRQWRTEICDWGTRWCRTDEAEGVPLADKGDEIGRDMERKGGDEGSETVEKGGDVGYLARKLCVEEIR